MSHDSQAPEARTYLARPPVERVWIAWCSRCSNHGTARPRSARAAWAELRAEGWREVPPRVLCPSCMGDMWTNDD